MKRPIRRGSILLAVMVVITLAALVGTTVLYRADAQRGSASTAMEHAQLRALAWSGVQAAMAEMSAQRGTLMQGEQPQLTASWDLYTGSVHGSVRLAPIGEQGAVVVSEDGKLDVNVVTAAMLAHLVGVDESLAGKVVAARGPGFGSAEELGAVDGVSAGLLFGAEESDETPSSAAGAGSKSLLSFTTVFSFDPSTTDGVGAQNAGEELERVSVSGGWSEDLRSELTLRMSAQAVAVLEAALKEGAKPAHDSEIVAALTKALQPVDLWGEVLDGVTTGDDQFRRGRVDVNSAPKEVLICVPGIDQAAADKIVEARGRLGGSSRQSVAWLLKEGILKQEQFQSAVDWISTRSLQWRVRVEARLEREVAGSSRTAPEETEETPPGMVWEAVIDVSGARARVAYLRDVTYLGALAQRARDQEKAAAPSPSIDGAADALPAPDAPGPEDKLEGGLGSLATRGFQPSSSLETKKLKMDNDLHFVGSEGSGRLNTDKGQKPLGDSGAQADGPKEQGAPEAEKPAEFKDRRIGRWRGVSKE